MKKASLITLIGLVAALLSVSGCMRTFHTNTNVPQPAHSRSANYDYSTGIVPWVLDPKPKIERSVSDWYLPARDEEVWFISRSPAEQYAGELLGSGALTTKYGRRQKPIPL